MTNHKWILLAKDDGNDAELIQRMLADSVFPIEAVRVKDGAEALDCLYRRNRFIAYDHGLPTLMLLDLNLPRVDGFEVLAQIKTDPRLQTVPVMVFTSSREPADMVRCYQLG